MRTNVNSKANVRVDVSFGWHNLIVRSVAFSKRFRRFVGWPTIGNGYRNPNLVISNYTCLFLNFLPRMI